MELTENAGTILKVRYLEKDESGKVIGTLQYYTPPYSDSICLKFMNYVG